MGIYRDLTETERSLLIKMAQASDSASDNAWLLSVASDGAVLLPLGEGGTNIVDVPASQVTYESLASKGYLAIRHSYGEDMQLRIEQRGLDCADYARRPKLIRCFLDCAHDLRTEETSWAKLFWLVAGMVIGAIMGRWLP